MPDESYKETLLAPSPPPNHPGSSSAMQPVISAMATLRDLLVTAIKALMRGKSFLQAFFTFWVAPAAIQTQNGEATPSKITTSTTNTIAKRTIKDFLAEAETLLLGPADGDGLRLFSSLLKAQFREGLLTNPQCMLPSYNHQLPNGHETGRYLALDVGGSTLRVALVELRSRGELGGESRIVRMDSFKIDQDVKRLEGMVFFDWMADRIVETLGKALEKDTTPTGVIPMGLAWSFPIEQTSLKGGRLHGMGKGFMAAEGLLGQDLGDIIKSACKSKGLDVELAAIVNDSSAALLSEAYTSPSTRFGLILGTGVNIAVHLPVSTIGQPKYGERPDSWFQKASHVIVNTELGMFGKDILPVTRWDRLLLAGHPRPEFQPLEHMVSGYYLGEVCRFALLEAIESTGVFGGVVPPSLVKPYSLDTETLSIIEADTTPSLEASCSLFKSRHPSPAEPTTADIAFLRSLANLISRRSASIVAASLFGLWELKAEAEGDFLKNLPEGSSFVSQTREELLIAQSRALVAFNGSVIEHYPNYRTTCQKYINDLLGSSEVAQVGGEPATIDLKAATESSLMGAAVALACLEEGGAN